VTTINTECQRAGIGCVDCKKIFAKNLNDHLEPFRARRNELGKDPAAIWGVLEDGAKRARILAAQTMAEVRAAVGLP